MPSPFKLILTKAPVLVAADESNAMLLGKVSDYWRINDSNKLIAVFFSENSRSELTRGSSIAMALDVLLLLA